MYVTNLHHFVFTRTIGPRVQPTLMRASFVCKTDNLLLLRISPPPIEMSPLLPYKEFMTTTKFEYVNRKRERGDLREESARMRTERGRGERERREQR
jgi:hypothetical protein